ncbi:MAG: hypothetical protein HeimC3_55200 [Candidatus Heimdallarchaeota archaeon LC_3]|nr:MAG: hypothetical protein HeimC3_55200 [Candidatus Heimdallarchaeota archaeon LC_3]
MSSIYDIKSIQGLNHENYSRRENSKWKSMKLIDRNIDRIKEGTKKGALSADDNNRASSIALGLIVDASFRIGSEKGSREFGTYGVSTIKPEHIRSKGNTVIFEYKGKGQNKEDSKDDVHQTKVISDPFWVNAILKQKELGCESLFCGITNSDVKDKLEDLTRIKNSKGTRNVHSIRAYNANRILIDRVLVNKEMGYREAVQEVVKELGHFKKGKLDPKADTAHKSYIHPMIARLRLRTGGFPKYGIGKTREQYLERK